MRQYRDSLVLEDADNKRIFSSRQETLAFGERISCKRLRIPLRVFPPTAVHKYLKIGKANKLIILSKMDFIFVFSVFDDPTKYVLISSWAKAVKIDEINVINEAIDILW